MLGDYEGAIEDYNKSISLNPNDAEAFNNRANIRMLFGDYNSAIDDYNLAIKLKENYSIALYNRGIAKIMTNKQGYACDDFKSSSDGGYEPALKALKDFCFQR